MYCIIALLHYCIIYVIVSYQKVKVNIMTTPADGMKRITLDLSNDLHKRLAAYCYHNNVLRSHFLREVIEKAISKNDFTV
jgi:hypothetical protein